MQIMTDHMNDMDEVDDVKEVNNVIVGVSAADKNLTIRVWIII